MKSPVLAGALFLALSVHGMVSALHAQQHTFMMGASAMVSKVGFNTGEYKDEARMGAIARLGYQRMLSERLAIRGFVAPEWRRSEGRAMPFLDEFGPNKPDLLWNGYQVNLQSPVYACLFLGEQKLWNIMLGASHHLGVYEGNSYREDGSNEVTEYQDWNISSHGFSAQAGVAYRMRLDAEWGIDLVAEGGYGARHDFFRSSSVRSWDISLGLLLYPKF